MSDYIALEALIYAGYITLCTLPVAVSCGGVLHCNTRGDISNLEYLSSGVFLLYK